MRVLVAGHSGVIGRQLVPLLQGAGHQVIGLSRGAARGTTGREAAGSLELVMADALDRDGLIHAVGQAEPDAVVHLLTAIPKAIDPRHIDRDMAMTNRLRTEGTSNLLDAAGKAGVRKVITQSVAFAYEPGAKPGAEPADEDSPLWIDGPARNRPTVEALLEHERLTEEAGGVALRFGHLYGPGTVYAADGSTADAVRNGKMPIVGQGSSVFSFTHTRDAATAITTALDKPVTGALNIVDDEPAAVHEWLPEFARLLGAKQPSRVPTFLARLMVGEFGVAFMTRLRGADNARARLMLDWRPGHPSWRDGFGAEL